MRPTPEFSSYLRTTKDQGRCEFRKIQQSLKVATLKAEPVLAEVRPLDIKYHRGQANHDDGMFSPQRLMSPRVLSPRA